MSAIGDRRRRRRSRARASPSPFASSAAGTTRSTMPIASASRRIDHAAGHQQLERAAAADEPRQQPRAAPVGMQSDAARSVSLELRRVGGDAVVARQREIAAGAGGDAVDRGDHRLRHRRDLTSRRRARRRAACGSDATSPFFCSAAMNSTSPPAQNARPAPVITTTRHVASSSAARSAARRSSRIVPLNAFSLSGRLSVIVVIAVACARSMNHRGDSDKLLAHRMKRAARLDFLYATIPVALCAPVHAREPRHGSSSSPASRCCRWRRGSASRTEQLAHRMGPTYGALFNATFGNFAEMVIAIFAIRAGLPDVVRASSAGSILGNLLFVAGLSMLAGGWKREIAEVQRARRRVAGGADDPGHRPRCSCRRSSSASRRSARSGARSTPCRSARRVDPHGLVRARPPLQLQDARERLSAMAERDAAATTRRLDAAPRARAAAASPAC